MDSSVSSPHTISLKQQMVICQRLSELSSWHYLYINSISLHSKRPASVKVQRDCRSKSQGADAQALVAMVIYTTKYKSN